GKHDRLQQIARRADGADLAQVRTDVAALRLHGVAGGADGLLLAKNSSRPRWMSPPSSTSVSSLNRARCFSTSTLNRLISGSAGWRTSGGKLVSPATSDWLCRLANPGERPSASTSARPTSPLRDCSNAVTNRGSSSTPDSATTAASLFN